MWSPQRPKFWSFAGDFGFWILGILDFGFWGFWILDFGSWGFWILDLGDFGFWILGILDFGLWGFWILDCGDFGSWILDRYVANLYVRPPTSQIWWFWILDFGGFGEFGFWILDFGDFGFWILRLGGWKSLGAKLEANFGFYIRVRRQCTPPRVGGFYIIDTMCVTIYKHVWFRCEQRFLLEIHVELSWTFLFLVFHRQVFHKFFTGFSNKFMKQFFCYQQFWSISHFVGKSPLLH